MTAQACSRSALPLPARASARPPQSPSTRPQIPPRPCAPPSLPVTLSMPSTWPRASSPVPLTRLPAPRRLKALRRPAPSGDAPRLLGNASQPHPSLHSPALYIDPSRFAPPHVSPSTSRHVSYRHRAQRRSPECLLGNDAPPTPRNVVPPPRRPAPCRSAPRLLGNDAPPTPCHIAPPTLRSAPRAPLPVSLATLPHPHPRPVKVSYPAHRTSQRRSALRLRGKVTLAHAAQK